MQTVCLITPPSLFLLDERVFMNLGILRVAAVLERSGHAIEMLDLSGIENFEEALADHARASSAQVFGLTATTPQMPAVTRLCRVIRDVRPDARLILGGPHITLVNAAARREVKLDLRGRARRALAQLGELADVLVAGDGEVAVFRALEPDAPGLVDADDPASDMFLTNDALSELPLPARHLIDVDSYHYSIDGEPALSLIAQLGCPFACGFCGGRESPSLRRIRMRTVDSIVSEIAHMHETWGTRGFMFYDDELNVNRAMVQLMNGISDAQSERGVDFRLRGFIKAQLFTDEQAEAMYRSGFRWILVGFESGSERILRNINKRSTRDENTRCLEIARRHGLKVKALMSIGHPGESEETIRDTEDWLLETAPDDFDVTIITTYPGTPYYDHAEQLADQPGVWRYEYKGDVLYSLEVDYTVEADYYKGDPDGGYRSFVYTDQVDAEALVRLRDRVEKGVRAKLGIAFNPGTAALRYEHSMGQGGALPPNILRLSGGRSGA